MSPSPEPARTWIHRSHKHELGRERHAARRPRNGDLSVFQRLPHHFERGAFELRQLIEKQNPVVREAHFAGRWNGGAAEQPDIRDGVMWRAKGPGGDERLFAVEHSRDAVDLRALDRLLERHRGHDRGDPFRQHRFAGTGRTDHQQVVPAGDRHFNGAFDVALPFHVTEIDLVILVGGEERSEIARRRFDRRFASNELECFPQVPHAVDGDPFHHRGFVRVGRGNENRLFLLPARFQGHRQHAFDGAHAAVQRQLADKAESFEGRTVEILAHGDHPKRDRQVEAGTLFLYVGRREIDRRPSARPEIPAVTDRRSNAIAAFFYRGIGQANDDNVRVAPGTVDLDFHLVGIDSIDGGRIDLGEHRGNA